MKRTPGHDHQQGPFFGRRRTGQAGFTLVELVVVIVIVGILGALGGMFIVQPIQAYLDVARRAELVDAAESALRRMQRDLRGALPNSIRIATSGGTTYLEYLPIVEAGLYQARGPGDILDFTQADDAFTVVPGSLQSAPAAGSQLVIYNLAAHGSLANAYGGDNRASVAAGSTTSLINLAPAKLFPLASPHQRFYLVGAPVTYACNPGDGTLRRYGDYGFNAAQPMPPGGGGALVTRHIQSCQFTYAAGTSQRGGLVTLNLSLEKDGERITLLHQVHVGNTP